MLIAGAITAGVGLLQATLETGAAPGALSQSLARHARLIADAAQQCCGR